jgi:NTE family protein
LKAACFAAIFSCRRTQEPVTGYRAGAGSCLNGVWWQMLALVLGGGGSRGALQAGALEVMFEAGLQPDFYVGTSIGSVNATALAAEPTANGARRLVQMWQELAEEEIGPYNRSAAVWNLLCGRDSCFNSEQWQLLIQKRLPAQCYGELAKPCYAVATDMDSGEPVVFGDVPYDSLVDGIMASTAAYPLFPAWEIDGRAYIDGGFVAMVPVRQAIERGATEIIAFDITNPFEPLDRAGSRLARFNRCIELLMNRQLSIDLEWAASRPQVTVKVIKMHEGEKIWFTDFSKTAVLIEQGRQVAEQALDDDEELLDLLHARPPASPDERGPGVECYLS